MGSWTPTEAAVREIRRCIGREFDAEEMLRIVLDGLRGEQSISEPCRREGIAANLYGRWSKHFLEVGKKQLARGVVREDGGEAARTNGSEDEFKAGERSRVWGLVDEHVGVVDRVRSVVKLRGALE